MVNTFSLSKMGIMLADLWKRVSSLGRLGGNMGCYLVDHDRAQEKKNGWDLGPTGSNEWNHKSPE